MSDFARALAERAARKLAEQDAARDEPRQEAAAYVHGILTLHPKAKLPQLLKLEETQELMDKKGVTKNILTAELSKVRDELKQKAPPAPIVVPKTTRRRGGAKKTAAAANRTTRAGVAQNEASLGPPALPFDHSRAGRVSNGTIEDL